MVKFGVILGYIINKINNFCNIVNFYEKMYRYIFINKVILSYIL